MRRPYYRRDRKKWFVKTDDGSTQIYLGETKREAYAAWESMRRQGEPGRWRIADLADAVVADAEARGVSKSHARNIRDLLARVAAAFPRHLAADLRPSEVAAWIARQPWGNKQKNHCLGAVRAAYRFGVAEGHLTSNPFTSLRMLPTKRVESVVTALDHWRLLLACRAWDEVAFLHLLWLTGARPGEIARATAADIKDGKLELLEHKTAHKGKRRIIYLNKSAVKLLEKQCRLHPKGPLVQTRDGTPWAKANWISLMRRRSEQAGVDITAYAYRRAFAARLIAAGVSIEDVAGLLGNTTTVALRAYVDLTAQSERLKEAAKRG